MTSSITISTDDLEKGQVNSQNETWIKPGKTFAVPVLVDRFNTTLCWEFNSTPKVFTCSICKHAFFFRKKYIWRGLCVGVNSSEHIFFHHHPIQFKKIN